MMVPLTPSRPCHDGVWILCDHKVSRPCCVMFKGDVPEQIDKYPEFTMFGELPSYGLYLRHIRNITLKNVQFSLDAPDFRPAIVKEDVEGLIKE